ncbi:MAG: hypothetical protein WAL03_18865, partial [Pseudolabrys sp.]
QHAACGLRGLAPHRQPPQRCFAFCPPHGLKTLRIAAKYQFSLALLALNVLFRDYGEGRFAFFEEGLGRWPVNAQS